jgi:hypothetical protein
MANGNQRNKVVNSNSTTEARSHGEGQNIDLFFVPAFAMASGNLDEIFRAGTLFDPTLNWFSPCLCVSVVKVFPPDQTTHLGGGKWPGRSSGRT